MQRIIPTYWFVTTFYLILTFIAVMLFASPDFPYGVIVLNRLVFVGLFVIVYFLKRWVNHQLYQLLSLLTAYAFLSTVYKETALLNTLFFEKQDALMLDWDYFIFGFQPSIEFSKYFDSTFFSELMFAGYFSYYIMPLVVIFSLYKTQKMEHFGFVLIGSFVFYYLIFDLFPVEGPQFHFSSPTNEIQAKGIFGEIVKIIQLMGEAPTAAFPSSHVGISVVVLMWLSRYRKNLIIYILPFTVLLFFATVYIKAHYAVDAIAGIFSGLLVYAIVNGIYVKKIKNYSYVDRS